VVLYISLVLGAHTVQFPRLLNQFVSNDMKIIHRLTAKTITTGAKIIFRRSPISYLSNGTSCNASPIESWKDRLSTKNGDSAITAHKIHTLTNMTSAVSSIGKKRASANNVLMIASITSARSSPLLV